MPRNLQAGFGAIYVFLRYLGLILKAGDLESFFAALRAALITGKISDENLAKLRDLFGQGLILIPFDTLRAVQSCLLKDNPLHKTNLEELRPAIEQGTSDLPCKMLCSLLKQGLATDDPLRADILYFVSSVTKQTVLLDAVLDRAQFTNLEHPKEFEIIYTNIAKQKTGSGTKRKSLSILRDKAVELFLRQNEEASEQLLAQTETLSAEEWSDRRVRLVKLAQDNLMVISRYKLSDFIIHTLLTYMDFHPESTFRLFYQNIVLSEDDTSAERWQIVYWVEETKDKAFIRAALSHIYRYEKLPEILSQIEGFLDQQKQPGGLGEMRLRVPSSSLNYERYMIYWNKGQPKAPDTDTETKDKNIDLKKCEALKKKIAHEGIKKIVFDAFCDQRLMQLAAEVIDAWTVWTISTEEAEEFKQRISNYDWMISRTIKQPSRGFSSADMTRTDMAPEEVAKANQQTREIADKLKKQ